MSVSQVGSGNGIGYANWRANVREAKKDFDQLYQAMHTGDLSAGQQAYAALQQLTGNTGAATTASSDATTADTGGSGSSATSSSASSARNTVLGDWSSLGKALQSGDTASAQSAFSQLEKDLVSAAKERHAEHAQHRAEMAAAATAAGQTTAAATDGATTKNTIGSDISALRQALTSGDSASAQNLLAKLEQDLQTNGQSMTRGHGHHHFGGFVTRMGASAYAPTAVSGTATTGTTATATTTAAATAGTTTTNATTAVAGTTA